MNDMLAVDEKGQTISRDVYCRRCGKPHQQFQLAMHYLDSVARISEGALTAMTQQVPGFWVPVYCPPCERKDLGFGQHVVDDDRRGWAA